jgi:hypothetical protein
MTSGIKLEGTHNQLKPKVTGQGPLIKKGVENSLSLTAFWKKNTSNKPFFPTKGLLINTSVGYHFVNELDIQYIDELPGTLPETFNTNPYMLAEARIANIFAVSEKLSIPVTAQIRYATKVAQGLNQQVGVGGFFNNYETTLDFWGAQFYEFQVHSFSLLQASLQYDISRNLLVIVKANYMNTEYPMKLWDDGFEVEPLNSDNDILGWGVGLAYRSILGPILLTAGSSDNSSKWIAGISLGFWH